MAAHKTTDALLGALTGVVDVKRLIGNRLGHADTHNRFCRVITQRNVARGKRIPIDFADGVIVSYR